MDEKAPNICDDAAFKKNIKLVLETSHPGRKIEHILYFFKKIDKNVGFTNVLNAMSPYVRRIPM